MKLTTDSSSQKMHTTLKRNQEVTNMLLNNMKQAARFSTAQPKEREIRELLNFPNKCA